MKIKYFFLIAVMCMMLGVCCFAAAPEISASSACLMEAKTGKVLYSHNADERYEPASVTKIMSLILVFEAIDDGVISLDTKVTASSHASSMGGSQIWLEEGETMTVNEMLKAVVVASANDCTVALAELVCGSEEGFVSVMNSRAKELGMNNTNFVNCTGLPAPEHYTTAYDIALMTRELHKHKAVYDYTKIWTDTLRGGEFGISNTNKLIRFYSGATGMKTGYTSSAKYCMSATACKNDMNLIASVMKCESSDKRFSDAKKLLDYGFANYGLFEPQNLPLERMTVIDGVEDEVELCVLQNTILVQKSDLKKITHKTELCDSLQAPFEKGKRVGEVVYSAEGRELARFPVVTANAVDKLTFSDILIRILKMSIAVR